MCSAVGSLISSRIHLSRFFRKFAVSIFFSLIEHFYTEIALTVYAKMVVYIHQQSGKPAETVNRTENDDELVN